MEADLRQRPQIQMHQGVSWAWPKLWTSVIWLRAQWSRHSGGGNSVGFTGPGLWAFDQTPPRITVKRALPESILAVG